MPLNRNMRAFSASARPSESETLTGTPIRANTSVLRSPARKNGVLEQGGVVLQPYKEYPVPVVHSVHVPVRHTAVKEAIIGTNRNTVSTATAGSRNSAAIGSFSSAHRARSSVSADKGRRRLPGSRHSNRAAPSLKAEDCFLSDFFRICSILAASFPALRWV